MKDFVCQNEIIIHINEKYWYKGHGCEKGNEDDKWNLIDYRYMTKTVLTLLRTKLWQLARFLVWKEEGIKISYGLKFEMIVTAFSVLFIEFIL